MDKPVGNFLKDIFQMIFYLIVGILGLAGFSILAFVAGVIYYTGMSLGVILIGLGLLSVWLLAVGYVVRNMFWKRSKRGSSDV